jgi:glutamate synthase (NADPH/NADH) small chain
MGKATGFMEYKRCGDPERDAAGRVKDWNEFHGRLSQRQRREQSGRCMDCGVPFCQAGINFDGKLLGCPLHNLIPEWNDMLYLGNCEHALSRLLKTSCFPEFTGRVCPALCEGACSCRVNGDSVSIRENELYIIEYAFENGLIAPNPPAKRSGKHVAVIGSGPAGLAAASFLNRRGHSVTVFEKDKRAGGLLMYGIPNMKLDKRVVARRIELMEQEGINFVTGTDVGRDKSIEDIAEQFDAVIACCGARKARQVSFDGDMCTGIYYALDYLGDATRALIGESALGISAKGKKVAVVGAGDSASDCIATAIRQGAEDVVQIIRKPASAYTAPADYAHQESEAVYGRDIRLFESRVKSVSAGEGLSLKQIVVSTPGGEQVLDADMLIIASGFSGAEDYVADMVSSVQQDKLFTAGDMDTGASLVVLAMAGGKHAAAEVDKYLMGYTSIE